MGCEHERIERIHKRFVADASHYLRTPVTAIRGEVQLLERRVDLDAETSAALNRIAARTNDLERLVDDLLLLAELDRQPLIPQSRCRLDSILLDVLAQFSQRAREKQIIWNVQMPGGSMVVQCATQPLQQALHAMLDTAIAGSWPGSSILISLERSGMHAVIIVANAGPGFPAEDSSTVFDRFHHTERTDNRMAQGVGLAIVKAVIEAHGGSIAITSVPNSGTTSTITLPLFLSDSDSV
jgi:two-component system OmpR family sensor kinase